MGRLTDGATRLREYLRQSGRTQCALAEELSAALGRRVHQGSVSAWMTGRYVPDTQAVVALYQVAKIPVEAWLPSRPERRRPRRGVRALTHAT